jgi:hypothetical protein
MSRTKTSNNDDVVQSFRRGFTKFDLDCATGTSAVWPIQSKSASGMVAVSNEPRTHTSGGRLCCN